MIISGIVGAYEAMPLIIGGISAISSGIYEMSHNGT